MPQGDIRKKVDFQLKKLLQRSPKVKSGYRNINVTTSTIV